MNLFQRVGFTRIEGKREAEPHRHGEFPGHQIEENDLGRAHDAGQLGRHEPDRTCPEDHYGLADEAASGPLQGVECHSRGLGHRRRLQGDPFGHADEVPHRAATYSARAPSRRDPK